MKTSVISLLLLVSCCYSSLLAQENAEKSPPPTVQEYSQAYGYLLAYELSEIDLLANELPSYKISLLDGVKDGIEGKTEQPETTYHYRGSYFYGIEEYAPIEEKQKAVYDMAFHDMLYNKYFAVQLLKEQPINDFLAKGIKDYFAGIKPENYKEEASQICKRYERHINEENYKIIAAQYEKKYAENIADIKLFLQKNQARKEVITTNSGLQYEIVKASTERKPSKTDRVFIHYMNEDREGQILFDSKLEELNPSQKPISLALQQLEFGFEEALLLMKKGAAYKFYISSDLLSGQEQDPANYDLNIITIELIDIQEDILDTEKTQLSYLMGYNYASNLGILRLVPDADQYSDEFLAGWKSGFTPNIAVLEKLALLYRSVRKSEYSLMDTLIVDPVAARQWVYCFGHYVGQLIHSKEIQYFDHTIVKLGFEHAAQRQASWINEELGDSIITKLMAEEEGTTAEKKEGEEEQRDYQKIIANFQREDSIRNAKYKKNQEIGADFLKKNAANKKVISLSNGLQYTLLKKGKGKQPSELSHVKIHCVGKLLDGTVVYDTYELNETAIVDLTYTDEWKKSIELMSVGSKYRFFVPFDLTKSLEYPYIVPIGSMIIYEVELVEIITY